MNANGIITAPVSISGDVSNVLGVSNTSLGYLASNKTLRINKFSKNKPMRYSSSAPLTDEQKRLATYGLKIQDVDFSILASETWQYLPPRGGVSEPYRLGDFNNYNHNALPIFKIRFAPPVFGQDYVVGQILYAYVDIAENQDGYDKVNNLRYENVMRNQDLIARLCLFDSSYRLRQCDSSNIPTKYSLLDFIKNNYKEVSTSSETDKFDPGERCIARVILTDRSQTPSIGQSLASFPGEDTLEFFFKPETPMYPPIKARQIDIKGINIEDAPTLFLLKTIDVQFVNQNEGIDTDSKIEIQVESTNGLDDAPRIVYSFNWAGGSSRDFTIHVPMVDGINNQFYRKNATTPMSLVCTVYSILNGQTKRVSLGTWRVATEIFP